MATMSREEKDLYVWTMVKTPDGRTKLVASLHNPLRIRVRLQSLAAQLLTEGIGVSDPVVFEETVSSPWSTFKTQRFHVLDRMQDRLRICFTEEIDTRLFTLVHENGAPLAEEFPEGRYAKVLMNAYTFADLGKRRLLDEPNPDVIGGDSGHFREARVIPSRLVEPGLLYGFGKPEEVGHLQFDIEVEDASEPEFDGALSLKNIGFLGTLTHRMALVDDARVAVYVHDML